MRGYPRVGTNRARTMRNFSTGRGLRAGVRKLSLALGATAAFGCLTFLGLAKAQTAPVSYSVYPVPGTLTASAKTQITFRGGDAASIGTVTVKGSRSGTHAGTLKPHSDGQGASFVPSKPFSEGEKVTVSTDRPVVGAPGGDFSFEIGDETRRTLRPVEAPDVGLVVEASPSDPRGRMEDLPGLVLTDRAHRSPGAGGQLLDRHARRFVVPFRFGHG